MYHQKKKTYPGRWVVKLFEAVLIFSIMMVMVGAIEDALLPSYHQTVVRVHPIEYNVVRVEPQRIEPQTIYSDLEYFSLAYDHQISGEYYDAIADYSRALNVNPDLSPAVLNRGVAYEELQNDYRAMQDFHAYLNRDGVKYSTPPANRELLTGARLDLTMEEALVYQIHFYAQAGQTLDISAVSKVEDLVDPLIVVTDSDGNPIAARDDVLRPDGSVISADSYIQDFAITRTGHYILLVSHAGGGSTGMLRVELNLN